MGELVEIKRKSSECSPVRGKVRSKVTLKKRKSWDVFEFVCWVI